MTHETAGDPLSGLGIHVCPQTVARLLKAMGYSLRVNHKKLVGASNPNRDRQFRHITDLRDRCAADNSPLISVDTKKKELVGTFRNPGAKWDRSPELVNANYTDHVFTASLASSLCRSSIADFVQSRAQAISWVSRYADSPYTAFSSANGALLTVESSLALIRPKVAIRFQYRNQSSSENYGHLPSGSSGNTCSQLTSFPSSFGMCHGCFSSFAFELHRAEVVPRELPVRHTRDLERLAKLRLRRR